jgi:hypothetical protein
MSCSIKNEHSLVVHIIHYHHRRHLSSHHSSSSYQLLHSATFLFILIVYSSHENDDTPHSHQFSSSTQYVMLVYAHFDLHLRYDRSSSFSSTVAFARHYYSSSYHFVEVKLMPIFNHHHHRRMHHDRIMTYTDFHITCYVTHVVQLWSVINISPHMFNIMFSYMYLLVRHVRMIVLFNIALQY